MKNDSPPVFIVGASRSGTTMLRLLLNAHSHVAIPNELSYFSSVPESWLESWKEIPASASEYRQVIRQKLFRKDIFNGCDIDPERTLDRMIESADSLDLSAPYRIILEAYAEAEEKSRWGEKTPTNLFVCDVLIQMFPDCKFIHLVRDPRAVVRSANNFPELPNDTVINATNWLHFMKKGYQLLVDNVPSDQRRTIRYEDLTSDPETVATDICTFIDEPFDSSMLNFYQEAREYMPSAIDYLGGDRKVTRPIYTDKQDRWRTELSHDEIGIVERICGEFMTTFGYTPTGARIQWRQLPDYILKYEYSLFKRWQHRRDRSHVIRYTPFGRLSRAFHAF